MLPPVPIPPTVLKCIHARKAYVHQLSRQTGAGALIGSGTVNHQGLIQTKLVFPVIQASHIRPYGAFDFELAGIPVVATAGIHNHQLGIIKHPGQRFDSHAGNGLLGQNRRKRDCRRHTDRQQHLHPSS